MTLADFIESKLVYQAGGAVPSLTVYTSYINWHVAKGGDFKSAARLGQFSRELGEAGIARAKRNFADELRWCYLDISLKSTA